MIQLDPVSMEIVKDILKKYLPNQRVVAFGSRVKGTKKPFADLDLCIMNDQPLSIEEIGDLREAFSESDLPIRVDIIEWASLTPDFKEEVNQAYEDLN